ncbi:MAG TPA: hypothetical protein VH678_09445 [Xanthobacteraceae bacterium]
MLKLDELKTWLHRDLSRADKLLLILGSFDVPCQVAEIKERGREAGLSAAKKWNVSGILAGTKGKAINTQAGWEIGDAGKQHLKSLGVAKISPAAVQVATDLRMLLAQVKDDDTRSFVEEAVQCYELELYRSAVVMSWLAAVHVLRREVYGKHLGAFNAEAAKADPKWKSAKTTDDIGRMKESDFLDRLAATSVIGKNVKEELQKCLKLRNACGHPSSLQIGPNTVASHIEILLMNVLQPYAR